MKNECIDCGRHFPGLNWVIDDDTWRAIAGRLDAGELCPWCADSRLTARGIQARARVSLALDSFNAFSLAVLGELEALDRRIHTEQGAQCQP